MLHTTEIGARGTGTKQYSVSVTRHLVFDTLCPQQSSSTNKQNPALEPVDKLSLAVALGDLK